jgi:hypothetical protein
MELAQTTRIHLPHTRSQLRSSATQGGGSAHIDYACASRSRPDLGEGLPEARMPPWHPPRSEPPNRLASAAMDYRVRIDSRKTAVFVIVALIVLVVLGWMLTDWL